MKNLLIALVCLLFAGCSATKKDNAALSRVLTNNDLKDKVGREWEKQNPCVTTITKVLPGKTVTVIDSSYAEQNISFLNEIIDSLLNVGCPSTSTKFNVDSFKYIVRSEVMKGYKQRIVTNLRVDTVYQKDDRRERLLENDISVRDGKITQLMVDLTTEKKSSNKKNWWIGGLIAIMAGGAFLKFKHLI